MGGTRVTRRLVALLAAGAVAAAAGADAAGPTTTFARAGEQALRTLTTVFYAGNGLWNACDKGCEPGNTDWGADSLTYTLYLRSVTAHDPTIATTMKALAGTAPKYSAPCTGSSCGSWSDVPEWDSIAASREYEVTHDPEALAKAKAAFAFVEEAKPFALGACPAIRYQQPSGGANHLKTLETDGNAIKAALLLYRETRSRAYLDSAVSRYASVRARFRDRSVPLYSVYVFDDGHRCTQLPHRFFASVNGDMIWSGIELARVTGDRRYRAQAIATAKAIARYASDPNGVYADLQAENDIVEPLVEAFYVLATQVRARFARTWIIRNASAALSARAADGAFGRFFDGPPPRTTVTEWQTNGGLALEIAAAALDPRGRAPTASSWADARPVTHEVRQLPATVTFFGSGVALYGTLGEICCESGHARVFVDGRETFDRTGIWQNKSSASKGFPDTVLFAWRWPKRRTHTIRFEAGEPNGKEGDSFLHLQSYLVR
jgi:hypothetical protein